VRLFKAANVIVQCLEQLFGMLWGQYYPALYLGFWSAGHQANKVHHKFRDGVVDDGKIGIDSFCRFLVLLNIYLFLIFLFFGHK